MFAFDNTYARLDDRFFARVQPAHVRAPRVVKVNCELARLLGVDPEALAAQAAEILSGNALPAGADPIALAYAGHQFGAFVPQLGDGRAILLGEVIGADGVRRDLQLKGSGRTPFSRGGDGRAALGPVLREYVVSEAMHALGIPTTRSLAIVTTGEPVFREEMLQGAVLTRVATSHIRIGTFQFFAARRDHEALLALTVYALQRHYPADAGRSDTALALLQRVIEVQAKLVAKWLGVGFIHGVMNTDNTSICGETIDYGPCAFLDVYDPSKKFSSIDHGGRYAFANQPHIAAWNLARLAEALLPLIARDEADAVRLASARLEHFLPLFEAEYGRVLRAKLGLFREDEGDAALAGELLDLLAANEIDFTVFFRRLTLGVDNPASDEQLASLFVDSSAFRKWAQTWRRRLADEPLAPGRAEAMRHANPALIARNHQIERAIEAAEHRNDFQPFERLVAALARPYDDQPESADLAVPPLPSERVCATFCGT